MSSDKHTKYLKKSLNKLEKNEKNKLRKQQKKVKSVRRIEKVLKWDKPLWPKLGESIGGIFGKEGRKFGNKVGWLA